MSEFATEHDLRALELRLFGGDRWKDDKGELGEIRRILSEHTGLLNEMPAKIKETFAAEKKSTLKDWRTTVLFLVVIINFVVAFFK